MLNEWQQNQINLKIYVADKRDERNLYLKILLFADWFL
jgi:hypothetical protein